MRLFVITPALATAACSKSADMQRAPDQAMTAFDVAESPASEPPPGAVQGPQIAYTYTLGYALADGAVGSVQARHVATCQRLGPARCRVARTELRSGQGPDSHTNGNATFLIDARLARPFIARLDAATETAGGRVADRKVEAEDLTKELIDTDARVRARQALADRLVALIRSQNANVGELVQAERAFADTQQELDAARQLQASLRQRVAMSDVTVDYSSAAASSAWAPVADSVRAVGGTLASSIAALVTFVVAALPWAIVLALLIWIGRRRGWRVRWPWRRRAAE